ncbi:tRNA (adenosine(37)-N6)-dimethylallyltransferase MiaA [Legionella israelensis]|uniref:tRNA dimethylallyltransferase n=1 Tax=Legionella israelensis TaxID=454 RepID=A0AAX1EDV4_9GAMM|nr:tRNA (adenosine(37)-N6)-dimethylallyltransferase MiaA [Legionella israelensis]QBR83296.1 tRNA (adenosine(37)-N6)-dimethylallyltransferase MiaA [Legionella israelensis]
MIETVFCLMGPTASGKTDLACQLVQRYPFEIVSVDSAMIYREMNIGTAKPTPEELWQTPHHLIDILDPVEAYSAARFCSDVDRLCRQIRARNKYPLLVGGTMMYFKALQQGLSHLPQADGLIRKQLIQQASTHGWNKLHQQLAVVDPDSASRIHPNDAQRIARALEVYYLTGTTLSGHLDQQKTGEKYSFINMVLFPAQRSWLHTRIGHRFANMLAGGLIEEVEVLINKWSMTTDMPALRCVGYRQVFDFLQGQFNVQTLKEKGTAATRQLAKRQLTWLRHWPDAVYFDPQENDCATKMMEKLDKLLDNNLNST